jgi:hypothetical protein
MQDESQLTVHHARRFLRANTTGDLRFDEHLRPIRYICAPSGALVAPVMVAMLQSVDTVLFVPECADDAMEIQVTLEQFEETGREGALADRWQIYHGQPEDVRWATMHIDAARYHEAVIDGDALVTANPLASIEASLCKRGNAAKDRLRVACKAAIDIDVDEPVMVGMDPFGIDVRSTYQVLRIEFDDAVDDPDDAAAILDGLLHPSD